MQKEEQAPVKVAYARTAKGLDEEKQSRNRDLDPQLIWRGKDSQDWSDLVVNAPPLYIQEKVNPKVLIDDLQRESKRTPSPPRGEGWGEGLDGAEQPDLFRSREVVRATSERVCAGAYHFVDVNKMVDLGSGSQREVDDLMPVAMGTPGRVWLHRRPRPGSLQ